MSVLSDRTCVLRCTVMDWLRSPSGGRSLSSSGSGLTWNWGRGFSCSRTESSSASFAHVWTRGRTVQTRRAGAAHLSTLPHTVFLTCLHWDDKFWSGKALLGAATTPSSRRNRSGLKTIPSKAESWAQQGPPEKKGCRFLLVLLQRRELVLPANAGFPDHSAGRSGHPVPSQAQPLV